MHKSNVLRVVFLKSSNNTEAELTIAVTFFFLSWNFQQKHKRRLLKRHLLIFSETGGGPTDDERIFGRDGFPIVGLPPALSSELQISESREVFAVIFWFWILDKMAVEPSLA